MAIDIPKHNSALAAVSLVGHGMCIGLGTGRTANLFIDALGRREHFEHLGLTCIPTSLNSALLARSAGLRVVGFEEAGRIDLAVDGADAVSAGFNLLKGMGGALTREKIVAYRARKFAVIADERKLVKSSLDGIVPVEVLPFALPAVVRELSSISKAPPALRKNKDNTPFRTDNGNYILDARMSVKDKDAKKTEEMINALPGVVENGIFTRADIVFAGTPSGCRTLINKKKFSPPYLLRHSG